MRLGARLTSLAAGLLALALCGPAAAKVSLEIFAFKPNKFAEKSFHERITLGPGLQADAKLLAALQGVYPDNRLLPDDLKSLPVVEITGADELLTAYNKAKGWFATTMKIFVKVSRDRQDKPPFRVLRLGFHESSVPLFAEELERLDASLAAFQTQLDKKADELTNKMKTVQDQLQGIQEDLKQEAAARASGDAKAGGPMLLYTGVAGALALFAILGLILEAQARKKHEALLKTELEKGAEPTHFLKL